VKNPYQQLPCTLSGTVTLDHRTATYDQSTMLHAFATRSRPGASKSVAR